MVRPRNGRPLDEGKSSSSSETPRVLERHPLRLEARPSIRRAEWSVRNLLVAKVDGDRDVIEDSGFPLDSPEYATLNEVDRERGEFFPAFQATVGFDGELREVLFQCFVSVNATLTLFLFPSIRECMKRSSQASRHPLRNAGKSASRRDRP